MPVEIQNPQTITEIKKIKGFCQYKKKKFIINLANENLTDAEISVLGRGSKFTDVPKDPKAYMLDRDAEAFMRKMRIRCLMANKKENESIVSYLHVVGTLCLHLVWI